VNALAPEHPFNPGKIEFLFTLLSLTEKLGIGNHVIELTFSANLAA
jgi:hypothetical protein